MKQEARGARLPDRQKGSAYLVALLALVVLTIVGLSLALITQTENQLGSNERTLNRVFYAADSGISFSIARALVNNDTTGRTFDLEEPDNASRLLQIKESVDTSPFYPILEAPCNLCEINNRGTGEYSSRAYSRTTYAVASSATRESSATSALMAQKALSSMVDVQPHPSSTEEFVSIDDPDQLKKVRY